MDRGRLAEILSGFERIRVLVVGDYFLDKYLDIDRALAEVSLETGLEVHQVVNVRTSPGAAGTVVSNLRALKVGVVALGVTGDDGEGYELTHGLMERGVDIGPLLQTRGRFTPTYTKPMMRERDGRIHELSRLDIKNRSPLPDDLERAVIERLRQLVPAVQGVIIADQVPERNYGVITDGVRQTLIELADEHPQVIIAADSRMRIGEFRRIVLKPNEREALRGIGSEIKGEITLEAAEAAGRRLSERSGRPVFVTVGERGILLCAADKFQSTTRQVSIHYNRSEDRNLPVTTIKGEIETCLEGDCRRIPAVPVTGEIDIVGAGDSTMAGIVSGLCCGATPAEAALLGNLVASVTIRCLGTTGTASQEEVLDALALWRAAYV